MKTLYDKIWDHHIVHADRGEPPVLYIDLHLIHEVSSPQAFDGLRIAGRKVRRPDLTIGTLDHGIPTLNRSLPFEDAVAAKQVETMRKNCLESNIQLFDLDRIEQGIVHVFAPEQGFVKPGMTVACGDSHTATHGAFGALAYGIGTSDVELILATQCLRIAKSGNFRVQIDGELQFGVSAKDLILGVINSIGTDGATGHVIEYCGSTIENLTMEGRMTVCNMSIEAGARSGLIAPDETTFQYLSGKPHIPTGKRWNKAVDEWRNLFSDDEAVFDKAANFDATDFEPFVTWGTSPGMSVKISGHVPDLIDAVGSTERESIERALEYMAVEPGQKITEIPIDRVFIGSCTNARIEDLRAAAQVIKGYKVAKTVRALVVPGSMVVKKQAEDEGVAQVFLDAGFEWRDAGCSMCLGMNDDVLSAGERCASTSNRNFEGRQGRGGRTHLLSPIMAAAAAVAGHFVDVRDWKFKN